MRRKSVNIILPSGIFSGRIGVKVLTRADLSLLRKVKEKVEPIHSVDIVSSPQDRNVSPTIFFWAPTFPK